MGYSELSLPADIPWKRLAVSSDMLDEKYGDLTFPTKWDSSIAVFYHEPVEPDPAYCNRRITYLKVVCTITNFQIGGEDVTILNQLRSKLSPRKPFRDFELNATRSYPCHGALLQVGVYPNPHSGVELYDFPYVASMQPRKRELYEVATESGEVASQSANKLNVMKGGTTTNTTEDYDLNMGDGSGGHSVLFGLWSEQHSKQAQVGSIQRSQTQNQNVATSDASRDRRESYSFSTSINQLHTLLQSYHLGTNRVMFFMQPVPHMQDAKFSFVRGVRRIEGVQEFFLIVNRPARVKGFCIEIALETAHLYVRRAYMPRLIPLSDLYTPANLGKSEQAIGSAIQNNSLNDWYRQLRDAWNYFWPSERWAMTQPGWFPMDDTEALAGQVLGKVPDIGIQDAALIFEEYDQLTGYFFVSGRRFCACWKPPVHEEVAGEEASPHDDPCEESSPASLSACDPFPGAIVFSGSLGLGFSGIHNGQYLNAVNTALNEALSSSFLSSERLPYGTGAFLATDFMLDELEHLVRALGEAVPNEVRISEFESVRRQRPDVLGAVAGLTVAEFLRRPASQLMRQWKLDLAPMRRLRRDVLVEALVRIDIARVPDEVSDQPTNRNERERQSAVSARGTSQPQSDRPRRTPRDKG